MRKGIVGAGNLIVDKIKVIDRWPGEGNLCNITSTVSSAGGGPCNILFDIAAADPEIPLYVAGRIGNDADGDYLVKVISEHGVDSSSLIRSTTAPTSYTDVMSGGGNRTFFHCRGASAELSVEDLLKVDVPAKFFYLAYLLLLDSLDALDANGEPAAKQALRALRRKGYKTVVDFVSEAPEKFRRTVLPSLPEIDILIVNELEGACCSGIEARTADGRLRADNLPAIVDFLFEKGVNDTVVIHFPEGAVGRTRDGKYIATPSCYIKREDIVGSNGAGDAFAAGVMYALHEGWDLERAMKLGSAFSNFNLRSVTTTEGAVSLKTMLEFLESCKYNPIPR
ncbi:MAG: carbohydrate kinase family protein [Lentisphaeria bacterium]|nr:carbohydrate kinase family protein [Lentisphaeria bacterium]